MKQIIILFIIFITTVAWKTCEAKTNSKNVVVENVTDLKDFKKILRTKTNVLVCFYNNYKHAQNVIKVFKETSDVVKGEGTMVLIDCSGEAKKMCKKLKVTFDESYSLKHYKDGEFNKDYDRKYTVSSMTNFMRDPTGDIPWEEEASASSVLHIPDVPTLVKTIKKEHKPLMIMFYAPWCGFCKTLKPEYAKAAESLEGHSVMAAIDVNRPENAIVRTQFNITGFPTMLYYLQGNLKYVYEGENRASALIEFMKNPKPPPVKIKETEWSDSDNEVVHLTANSFDPVIKEEASVLVMFYAPWCGHCKKMKPEYETAAATMKAKNIPGMLAALDATKEQAIASRFNVKGYPTIKYFSYGELKFDVNVREANKIIEFMKDPQEPPPPPPPEKPWSDEEGAVVHLTEETFKPFLKKKKHVLVMFYAPWCGHCKRAKPEFTKAAEAFKDDLKVEFAAVDCTVQSPVCNAYDVKGYPTLMYFNYLKNTRSYSGGRSVDDFVSYMRDPLNEGPQASGSFNLPSSIFQISEDNFNELNNAGIVLVMFYDPNCSHCQQVKPMFIAAAEELSNKGFPRSLGAIDVTANRQLATQFGVSNYPTFVLFKNGKYVGNLPGIRSTEEIVQFLVSNADRRGGEL